MRWTLLARRTGCVSRALSYVQAFVGEDDTVQAEADWPVRALVPRAARGGRLAWRPWNRCTRSPTMPSVTWTRWGWSRPCTPARCRCPRSSRPRSHGPRRSTPRSTPSRSAPSTGPGSRRATPRDGFFAGVPTFLKDNVDVAGMPTQQGSDAFVARPARADGDFARMYLATGLVPLGKSQLSEFGFSAAAEHVAARSGPLALAPRPLGRGVLGRLVRAGRRRGGPDRARQRRRRLDPDPGLGQRAGRPQADPRPPRPGQVAARHAGPDRRRRRGHPDGARHRGVLPRGREGLPQPRAGPDRRHHAPRPSPPHGRGGHRCPRARGHPGGPRAHPQDRGAGRGPGPPRRGGRRRRSRPRSATTSSSTGRCSRWPSSGPAGSASAAPGTRTGSTT